MVAVLERQRAVEGSRLAVIVAVLVAGCVVPLAGPMLPSWSSVGRVGPHGALPPGPGVDPGRAATAAAAVRFPGGERPARPAGSVGSPSPCALGGSIAAPSGPNGRGPATPAAKSPALSTNLSALIETPRSRADVGVAIPLNVSVVGGLPPYSVEWSDSLGGVSLGPNWSLQLGSPSIVGVSARVLDSDGSVYLASRVVTVVSGPSANVSSPVAGGDPGVPFPLVVRLAGGVPPYSVAWSVTPNGSSGSETVETASEFTTSVTADAPGAAWATVTVTDADGEVGTTTARVTDIAPAPSLILTGSAGAAEAGRGVTVSGLWSGGVEPVVWTVAASLPVVDGSAPVGTLGAPGPLAWSGTFAAAGNATVVVEATDADGVTILRTLSLEVYPALTVGLALGAASVAPANPIPASAEVSGGLAPYTVTFAVTGGGATSGNLSAAGPAVATLSTGTAGFAIVSVSVRDALGVVAIARSTILVSAAAAGNATTATPPAAAPSWVAWPVALLTIGGAAAILLWPRLRRRRSPAPAPNSLGVVRKLLEDGTPLDRETLVYLAEEEGSPPDRTRAAVESWERAGRVRVDPSDEGAELLTWVERAAAPARPPEGGAP